MDREEKVASFCDITGASPEQAAFFLEGCNWDLDNAVSSFLDEDSHGQSGPSDNVTAPRDKVEEVEEAPPSRPSNPGASLGGSSARGGSSRSSGRGRNSKPSNSRIKTFSELNRASQDDNDDDDDDEPNEYYTGGEKSGMMVQDPKKGNRTSDVDAIFERARQFGAREGNIEDVEPTDSRKKGSFSGRGRTLTSSTEESDDGGGQQATPEPAGPTRYTITFWRNGFTVDNGPLRLLSDPANTSFLTSINRGECPRELAPKDRSSPVEVNLMKKDEDYTPPPEPRYSAFSGTGRTLGGTTGGSSSSEPPATSSRSNVTPHRGLVVDDSKPVTSIQLRLSDGTRMVSRFNLDHTVADIRAFIDASRPGNSSNSYQLQSMGFPPKPLLDPSQTIEAAGLVNSVVVQR